jgi:hypothetical protein
MQKRQITEKQGEIDEFLTPGFLAIHPEHNEILHYIKNFE